MVHGQIVVRYNANHPRAYFSRSTLQGGGDNGESRYTILREGKKRVCEKTHRS